MANVDFGIGTNFDWRGNTIDGEPLLMEGYPTFESGSISDSWSVTMVKVYQIYAEDFIALCLYQPRKGQSVWEILDKRYVAWFQVESVRIEREGSPIIRGRKTLIHVRVTMELILINEPSGQIGDTPYPETLPWELPPYNFKMGTELLEESVQQFWNAATEQFEPFVNTAGVPLQATGTRPLVRISFSFNLQGFEPSWTYQWTGCVNSTGVTICGIYFEPGMVKLESLDFETCKDEFEYDDIERVHHKRTVNFTKCNAVLLVDPRYDEETGVHGFIRQYLNVGMHIWRHDGLHRLWSATTTIDWLNNLIGKLREQLKKNPQLGVTIAALSNQYDAAVSRAYSGASAGAEYDDIKSNATTVYGTAAEMSYFSDPEEVTENMFLNEDGTDVSEIGEDGRQTPTFRAGYIDRISDFSGIGLPEEPPYILSFVDEVVPEEQGEPEEPGD